MPRNDDIRIDEISYNNSEQSLNPANYRIMGSTMSSKEGLDIEKDKSDLNIKDADDVTHPTSYIQTMLHIFKGNIGSGLLAMGDAFKNGGIIFSPIMTIILGLISVHAQHILLNCSDELHRRFKKKKAPNFAETVGMSFEVGPPRLRILAKFMERLVNIFLCVTQLGFCCVYIVFIATNFKVFFSQYVIDLDLSVHMAILLVPVQLLCMVRKLKYLTPFSTFANFLMVAGVGVVIYKAAIDTPPINTRDYIASYKQLPLYFGTVIFAFEGIGLVLPLKKEMKNPDQFQKPLGVLNVGMVIVGSIIITVGFLGYLKWGDQVQGSLTLNLIPSEWTSVAVQITIAVAMMFTYPLQFYVPIEITWPYLKEKYPTKRPVLTELLYRVCLVLLTFVLAESIPHLSLVISLVGAISSTALALIFPPLIEIIIKSQEQSGCSLWVIAKNTIIIVLGLFIFVTGTFESILAIVHAPK